MKIFFPLWPNSSERVLSSQLQGFSLSSVVAALHLLPPTSSSALNKNGYIRSGSVSRSSLVVYIHYHSSELSDTLQEIYIYWLLWYKPLITWRADLFPHRTTRASSSFPTLSRWTIPHKTDLWHRSIVCEITANDELISYMRIYWQQKMLAQNTPGDVIAPDHMLLICLMLWIQKQKPDLTLCCFPPSWLM